MKASGGFAFRRVASGGLAGAVAAAALVAGSLGSGSTAAAGEAPARPNIVVIQSDDQTAASIEFMDRTLALLGERGTTFANHYVNWPVCCPSRATCAYRARHSSGVRSVNS